MTLRAFMEKIELPADAAEAVLQYEVTDEESARLEALYDRDYEAFDKEITEKEPENPHLAVLALYCRWAVNSLALWEDKGLPEEIAIDTFRDITLWSNRLRERIPGKIGLMEWKWFTRHKKAELFRLGRLQFEPVINDWEAVMPDGTELKKGEEVLFVHIPRGERMTEENMRESFDMAKEFFPKYFGKAYDTYICMSWLLAPALGAMVKEDSGIAGFRRYFFIFDEELGYSQAEDYVFTQPNPDKTKYPENTGLQRNLKKYLVDGGVMGMGKGFGKF